MNSQQPQKSRHHHHLRLLPLLLLLLCIYVHNASAKRHRIWPHPQEITISDEFYLIYSRDFRFLVTNNRCDVINQGVARIRDRMFTQDCSKIDPRLAGTFLQPGHVNYRGDKNYRGILKELYIRFNGECEHYPQMNMNERYEIRIAENGIAEILATSVWGVLRGLDTFAQLVENVGANQFIVNKAKITDYPRFAHRGLMIDTSRHFLSVKSIYKTLNAMELNKLNVLHWHVVDDQAFPFESLSFPQLAQKGAYIPQTHVYRPRDVEGIIEYARLRGIRVLVEFDTPGHTQSWGKGMPNLLTQCYSGAKPNGATGPIDPTRQSNYDFLRSFFTEVARRFPDQYLHLGGDEVDTKCWASNPRIQNFMRKRSMNVNRLESFYVQRLVNIVKNLGKSYIVWQEVFDEGVKIKPDTVVHVWIEKRNGGWRKEMSKVTKAGYRTLLSAPWYLEEQVTESWRKYYETDPLDFDGTPAQKRLVLGGEACIWGEYADGGNLINKVWTTTSALAEKLWSPEWLKSAADAEWRFFRLHCRMQVQGIRVGPPSGPSYCPCDHVI